MKGGGCVRYVWVENQNLMNIDPGRGRGKDAIKALSVLRISL